MPFCMAGAEQQGEGENNSGRLLLKSSEVPLFTSTYLRFWSQVAALAEAGDTPNSLLI